MRCQQDPLEILRYVAGDLGERERTAFARHLEECVRCRAQVADEEALSRLFRRTAPLYTAPPELRSRVARAMEAASLPVTAETASSPPTPERPERDARWGRSGILGRLSGVRPRLVPQWVIPAFCTVVFALLSAGLSRELVQQSRARAYVEAAIEAHRDTLEGRAPLGIQSDAPAAVTRWADERASFHLRLPDAQGGPDAPRFRIKGARLVELPRGRGVLVTYHRERQDVSLLVAPEQAAVIRGGDAVQDGRILFHYRNQAGFNVITWKNHGLGYALVSSVSGPARQSCLVCHGSLPGHVQSANGVSRNGWHGGLPPGPRGGDASAGPVALGAVRDRPVGSSGENGMGMGTVIGTGRGTALRIGSED